MPATITASPLDVTGVKWERQQVHRALFLILALLASPGHAARAALVSVIPSGLSQPVGAYVAPGADTLYVVEQVGRIQTFEKGKTKATLFLDIHAQVVAGGEMGLLGLAFHPEYAANGRYYLNYTQQAKEGLSTVIEERVRGKETRREILSFRQPFSNHNGGQLAFAPKAQGADRTFLYIATGDGGSGGDPHGNGQNPTALLGKILRVQVEGTHKPEVYAYGLRNPWRFSFDPLTGLLYAADVGQYQWEEIHVIERGKNYGWNKMEGSHCFKPAKSCDRTGLEMPIAEYNHDQGISITGGYVYRGKRFPQWAGMYVYGDYGSGTIWGLRYDPATKKASVPEVLLRSHLPISSFGVDADGEILVVSHLGAISRLEAR